MTAREADALTKMVRTKDAVEETVRKDVSTRRMISERMISEEMTSEKMISAKTKTKIVHRKEEKKEEITAQAFQLQKLQCRNSRTEKLQTRAKIKTITRRKIIVLMMAITECRKGKKVVNQNL